MTAKRTWRRGEGLMAMRRSDGKLPSGTLRRWQVAGPCGSLVFALGLSAVAPALAWSDKGHQVVALVARAQLTTRARAQVDRLLAGDDEAFTMRDGRRTSDSFDRQATWADYYRDAQRRPGSTPDQIHSYHWHFADIELHGGSLDKACYGFPPLAPGVPASEGQDPDCVVDKIEQFAAELAAPAVDDREKRLALKFLLHFVGDLHQPLHASDDADHGGNDKRASLLGAPPTPLHRLWDSSFVDRIAATAKQPNPNPTPAQLVAALPRPSAQLAAQWQHDPNPRRWALETYAQSRHYAYGNLPQPVHGAHGPVYPIDKSYADQAARIAAVQLNKAGYRLAAVLNRAFAEP